MQVPIELDFHGVDHSDWAEEYVHERAARLERYADNINSCRVVIEQHHHHQHKGNPYRVRVEVTLPPQHDLVASEEPAQVQQQNQLKPVIRGAFEAMERQLQKAAAKRRDEVKHHAAAENRGIVVRLFPDQDFGFLRTPEDREFYFHRNSVLHGDFGRLDMGTEVRFEPEEGDEGPQASSVQIVNKPGARASEEDEQRSDVPPGWRPE